MVKARRYGRVSILSRQGIDMAGRILLRRQILYPVKGYR